jgi:SAM-dependent methyltransferase
MQTAGLILDYGCGNGMRTRKFAQHGWQLCGIDISEESIRIARRNSAKEGLRAEYYIMDGENMTFPDNQFDLIVDYGAFSSVDMKKVVPDLLRGIRTKWSAKHIMKLSDWTKLKNNFNICKTKFFGVTTALIAPLIWCVPQRLQNYLITCCEKIDNQLLKSDMVKPWAFKTVVQLSKPK